MLAAFLVSVASACAPHATAADILVGVDFESKVVVVTGGDAGLGYAAGRAFAQRNATVVLASHNATKVAAAAARIAAETANSNVRAVELDLADFSSVRKCAQLLLSQFDHMDVLVNNAGIAGNPGTKTADGFERLFQTDYLGHFLLTDLLLPKLEAAAGRVVSVSSGAHEQACEMAGWPEGCFADWTYMPPPLIPRRNVTVHYRNGETHVTSASMYGAAKWFQIQHVAALAEKQSRITAVSVSPGFANTTMTGTLPPEVVKQMCGALPQVPCPYTAEQGAAILAFAAVGRVTNGGYYHRSGCAERAVVMHGFPTEHRARLYALSAEWTAAPALVV